MTFYGISWDCPRIIKSWIHEMGIEIFKEKKLTENAYKY